VTSRPLGPPAALAVACLAAGTLLAGCGTGGGPAPAPAAGATPPPATPPPSTTEPGPAVAQASAEAAADPARATDAKGGALAAALRPADLPGGWSVQANPVPDTADLSGNPSLAGICGAGFPSEAHRTAKYPVVGLDATGTPLVESESISYDTAGSAAGALQELRAAFAHCSSQGRTVGAAPRVDGLAADSVVVEYTLAGGVHQEVVAQARGAVVSVLLAEDEAAAARAGRGIAARLAALPAAAVGS
jgi:hypothetical protein